MANIKIKRHNQIQAAVDNRQGHTITKIAYAHLCAVVYADDPAVTSGKASLIAGFVNEMFQNGIEVGLDILQKFQREAAKFKHVPEKFGIYVAKQETSDGDDYLYFIGTPNQILMKLLAVPATEGFGADGVLEPGRKVFRLSAGKDGYTNLSATVGPHWLASTNYYGLARVSSLPKDGEFRKVKLNPDTKNSARTVVLMNIKGQLFEVAE